MLDNFLNGLSGYVQGSSPVAYVAVYLGGVLVSSTPCVYPVVPITVAYVGSNSGGSRGRGFSLSLAYVLGMAATYTLLGAVAALSGKLFGLIQTSPWTYFFIGNVCLLMGLSMLGLFTLSLRMPDVITRMQSPRKMARLPGSFLLGAASGLVVGPCMAPVLAVVLSYAATRQNVLFASSLMFVFAVGMGTLLIVLGTFTGLLTSIPKSGMWMARISRVFGWVLLGTGEYFLINAGMLWF